MATLTRAWSLYKANQLDESASAFRDFASRFPQLPQRDESRLMIGQIMLQQGRVDDAGTYFQGIADSLTLEISGLRERGATAVQEAAKSFVAARAATLLFLTQPEQGKALALNDNLGMDLATVAAALGQSGPVMPPSQLRPELVSLADIEPRLDSIAPASSLTLSHRVVYISGDSGSDHSDYVQRSQALREADVGVALARYRLAEQLDSHNAKLALVEALQQVLGTAVARLDTTMQQLTQARDSLARVMEVSAATQKRLEELMRLEAQAVAQSAEENSRKADSLRASFQTMLSADDSAVMEIEAGTAATYRALAENVMANLTSAFANHPVMRLQDSVRAHLAQSESLVDQTRSTIASTNDQLSAELARLRASQAEESAAARGVVASAEGRRAQAESALIAAVEAELRSRAGRLLALVQHDAEAAEFGAASASFFKAVGSDTTRAGNAPAGGNR
jgi:TolA-binding protein